MKEELQKLSRKHLIALAVQRTNMSYKNILAMDDYKLIAKLATVKDVLVPVEVSQ